MLPDVINSFSKDTWSLDQVFFFFDIYNITCYFKGRRGAALRTKRDALSRMATDG